MANLTRFTSFFTPYRLMVLLLLLQILFLTQLSYIWILGNKLRERRQQAQKGQEEKIVTPGMIRGMN